MENKFNFFIALLLTTTFISSCEIKNQYKDKKSKTEVSTFKDNQLDFTIDLSDFTKGELTVYFKIGSISKEYKIDSLSLTLHDNKSNKNFQLKNINTYDGMFSENKKSKEFANFDSAIVDRKIIDPKTINAYYAIDHIFLVPNVNDTKNYRVDITGKFTTKDSSYKIVKSIIFKRSKHFVSIRWSGC